MAGYSMNPMTRYGQMKDDGKQGRFWGDLFMGGGLGLFGGGNEEEEYRPPPPNFYEDADFRTGQDYMMGMGTDIMRGDIPEYYRPIGETNSPQFEAMLGKSNRDVMQSTSEALAKGGRARGGQLAASTAGAVADNSINARYDDYERAMSGRIGLLGVGSGMVGGARDAGLKQQGNVNEYNWKQYDEKMGWYMYDEGLQREEDDAKGKMYGSIGSMAENGWNAWQQHKAKQPGATTERVLQ